MCESAAYILKEDGMERIMDNVVSVDPFEGKVYLTDLLGEQKIVDGEIKEIRLMDHKIIIKENKLKIIGDRYMVIAVIDGMGGGIGAQIVSNLREELPTYIDIYALGTNSIATSAMMKAHANKGATGENAIITSVKKANIIVAPVSITMPNSMMGEVTSKVSEAVVESEALKILLPIMPENIELVGLENKPLALLIKDSIKLIKNEFNIK